MAKVFQVDTNSTLTTNLVAYWNLDEASGTRVDFFSTHNLTVGTAPTQVAGKVSNAVSFASASSQYLTAGNDSAFDNPGDFSVAFWFKTGGQGAGYHQVLGKFDASSIGWSIVVNGDVGGAKNKLWFILQDSGATHYLQRYGSTVFTDSVWHLCIFTRTGQTMAIYVDNAAETLTDPGSSGIVGNMSNTTSFDMGGDVGLSGRYLDGAVDECGFWTKVLSAQEMTDLWNGGSGQTMVVSATVSNFLLMGV